MAKAPKYVLAYSDAATPLVGSLSTVMAMAKAFAEAGLTVTIRKDDK